MSWTSEYPTKPGFYWIRNYQIEGVDDTGPLVALVLRVVYNRVESFEFQFHRNGAPYVNPYHSFTKKDLLSAEWQGPIEPADDEYTEQLRTKVREMRKSETWKWFTGS